MLRIACESCHAPYQVDERRVPPAGLKMRCPKCGHSFVVKQNGETAPVETAPSKEGTPSANRSKATMVGVAAQSGASPATRTAAAASVDEPASQRETAPELPRMGPQGSAIAAAAKLTRPELPKTRPEAPKSPPKPPPPAPRKVEKSGFEDLPAARSEGKSGPLDVDLPAAKPTAKIPATRPPLDADLPAAKAPMATGAAKPRLDSDRDLPARAKTSPAVPKPKAPEPQAPAARDMMELDLPANASDLPARAEVGLPARGGDSADPFTDDPFGGPDSFGEIDLPALGENLPSVPNQLPAVANSLPEVAGTLPAVANALPAVGQTLPKVADALPAKANYGSLVDEGDPFGAPISEAPSHALNAHDGGAGGGSPFDDLDEMDGFGAALLGPARTQKEAKERDLGATDVDAPHDHAEPVHAHGPAPSTDASPKEKGFGEVDLGGSSSEESASLDAGAELDLGTSTAPEDGTELALPMQSGITAAATGRKRTPDAGPPKKRSRAPAIFAACIVVIAAAGAGLHFTPYGLFGRNFISDTIHQKEYDQAATRLVGVTRAKAATDVFSDSLAATEDAAREHAALPRAHGVAAYAALTEFLAQLRFGRVPERAARANLWMQEIPPEKEHVFAPVARALQTALDKDLPGAVAALEAAANGASAEPVALEIALGRGEVELQRRSGQDAVTAFTKAAAIEEGPRAHFGLARAYVLLEDVEPANKEIQATLKLSPNHVGARTLSARSLWDFDRNEKDALQLLAKVIEGATGTAGTDDSNVSLNDLADAYAERGWIHLAKGRATEARAAFDGGLKAEPQNIRALLGYGELFFNEGRYAEALARFDLAMQTAASDPVVVVANAKAKMMLERLQDAKTQLAAAKAEHPENWRVSYWLARTEQTLGNQEATEKEYA